MIKNLLLKKDNLIFDFDLTLVKLKVDWTNWHTGIANVYSEFDKKHGYYKGLNPHEYYNKMVDKFGNELVKAVQLFNASYEHEHVKDFIPSKILIPLIKEHKNKKYYIFSSNSRRTIEKGLAKLEIDHLFTSIVSRNDTRYLKPDPEGFSLIQNINKNKNSFLMIGDSSSDEQAANSAGISYYQWTECDTYKF